MGTESNAKVQKEENAFIDILVLLEYPLTGNISHAWKLIQNILLLKPEQLYLVIEMINGWRSHKIFEQTGQTYLEEDSLEIFYF